MNRSEWFCLVELKIDSIYYQIIRLTRATQLEQGLLQLEVAGGGSCTIQDEGTGLVPSWILICQEMCLIQKEKMV